MDKPFVYGLLDPREPGHIRYVGMAPSRSDRPWVHAEAARRKSTKATRVVNWIRQLQSEGLAYQVLLLEELPEGTTRNFLGFVEACYIESLHEIGHRLTNTSAGGWGGPTRTEEQCRELSKRYMGHPVSWETRQKISAARLAQEATNTPEQERQRLQKWYATKAETCRRKGDILGYLHHSSKAKHHG